MTTLMAFAISASMAVAAPQPVVGYAEGAPTVAGCCEAELDRAHALRVSGDAAGAQRAYRAIVRQQRAAGEFPGEALWQIAEIDFARGSHRRALRTMEDLAQLAADHGRPSMQVRALLVSAMIHDQSNRNEMVLERVERIEKLLASPDVSQDTRAWVQARLSSGTA